MAKTWDDFLPLANPHLPGCPDATIRTYLASTASTFFARTYLWREQIDAVYTANNQVEYDLDADTGIIEDIIGVVYNEQQLVRTDIRFVGVERLSERGEPREYWIQADQTLRIFPIPESRAALKVYAVLKPSRSGTGVEDWIYETWADTLVSGTIYQLANTPDKEWSNPQLANMHGQLYENAINKARVRDTRGVRMAVKQRPAA